MPAEPPSNAPKSPDSPEKPPESSAGTDWIQWTGAGFEFAAAVLLFFLLGSWLDATWGTQPWLRVAGALVGIVAGTYLLIRQALRSTSIDDKEGPKGPS